MELLIFYPLAIGCVILALMVILQKNPVSSAICLIGMMLGLAAVFVLLRAHFIAILQVLVYAGAIMVLFMFVIMLLNLQGTDVAWTSRDRNKLLTTLTGFLAVGILYKIIDIGMDTDFPEGLPIPGNFGTVAVVGEKLFTDYVLPFEVASILLLVAMVGALVLAKSKVD